MSLIRLSASITPAQRDALELYAIENNLLNQFGRPGINKTLRRLLGSHTDLQKYFKSTKMSEE